MAATRHRREGLQLPVFLLEPQFGCVLQLAGEAGKPSGNVNWHPVTRRQHNDVTREEESGFNIVILELSNFYFTALVCDVIHPGQVTGP